MANHFPFMLRRGNHLHFRVQVPIDLRNTIGQREFTRSLKTGDRSRALPLALELGAIAKRLFDALRDPTMSSSEMLNLLKVAQAKLKADLRNEELHEEIHDLRSQHRREIQVATLQAKVDAYELALARSNQPAGHTPDGARQAGTVAVAPGPTDTAKNAATAPTVFKVIDTFLASYPKAKQAAMFKKHLPALTLLRDFLGDKPVTELRQADLNDFFVFVARLPPRWTDTCKRLGITSKELAKTEHPVTLGPKTFDDNYVVPVRLLIKSAIRDWQDQGFPSTLTTEGIKYRGDRREGENRQRAFTKQELERLFNGAELKGLRGDPLHEHKWWLLLIGLFTGARVNEICQLNPQVDFLTEPDSGIPYLWITNETEGDDRIKKSTKNTSSKRKMPIHSKLVELGLLDQLASLKARGEKLVFPAWNPINGKASTQAEKWFREFLVELGLRDDTPFAKITGMHAFRHTLLTRASNTVPRIDAGPLTGHVSDTNATQRGYEAELSLTNKRRLLEGIDFGFVLNDLASLDSTTVSPEVHTRS